MNALQDNVYYDNPSSRSPRSNQHQPQTIHRGGSRQFEQYPHVPAGLFDAGDPSSRFDPSRYGERVNPALQGAFGTYDMGGPQAWNSVGYGHNNTLAALGATTRYRPNARGRGHLPDAWLDQGQNFSPMGGFQNPASSMGTPSMRHDGFGPEVDEELIPTAIVIKNIPFAVKKEQLQAIMTELHLPTPYAFNYHFDNGVFRGLAFANFTSPEETAAVIERMNHFELHGRKLRVEYKKMLPAAERERIEREKRERRGQLEEQHRPMTQLQTQPSGSSLNSHPHAASPSPLSARAGDFNIDMNNPTVLGYYTKLATFKGDLGQEILTFPPSLNPEERRLVHTLAHMLELGHTSYGSGSQRQVHVFRNPTGDNGLSPILPASINPLDAQRRGLNRAATTDFTDVKQSDPAFYGNMNKQSPGFLGFPDAQGLSTGANLRAAKSFADLRSYTPSPAASTSSFPTTLTGNASRFAQYGQNSPGSTRSTITPTTTSMPANNETLLVNGLNTMDLNSGFVPSGGSPRRLRGMMSWDPETPGPIGSHRAYSSNYDDPSRNRTQGAPLRQPRGPVPDRGSGFPRGRQNGHQQRGSDDLSPTNGVDAAGGQ